MNAGEWILVTLLVLSLVAIHVADMRDPWGRR